MAAGREGEFDGSSACDPWCPEGDGVASERSRVSGETPGLSATRGATGE